MTDTPGGVRVRAPLLGEHIDEVLAAAGYGPSEILGLRNAGVIK